MFQSRGRAIIEDAKGNLMGPGHPAHAGDVIVIYCAGLGAVNPPVADGVVAPSTPLSSTVNPVIVTIGGQSASVLFAGLATGAICVYQIKAVVPTSVTPGDQVPITVAVGGQLSQTVSLASD